MGYVYWDIREILAVVRTMRKCGVEIEGILDPESVLPGAFSTQISGVFALRISGVFAVRIGASISANTHLSKFPKAKFFILDPYVGLHFPSSRTSRRL